MTALDPMLILVDVLLLAGYLYFANDQRLDRPIKTGMLVALAVGLPRIVYLVYTYRLAVTVSMAAWGVTGGLVFLLTYTTFRAATARGTRNNPELARAVAADLEAAGFEAENFHVESPDHHRTWLLRLGWGFLATVCAYLLVTHW
jgi:hypothetical protein